MANAEESGVVVEVTDPSADAGMESHRFATGGEVVVVVVVEEGIRLVELFR